MYGMVKNVFLMWGKTSKIGTWKDAGMLLLHACAFNFYLFELFYGNWSITITKGYLYGFMSIIKVYLAFSDKSQFNLINNLSFAFNFALFFLTLLGLFKTSILYMLLYNGAIIVLTAMVLTSGLKHGIFNTSNEND